jgi:hypothetical protein
LIEPFLNPTWAIRSLPLAGGVSAAIVVGPFVSAASASSVRSSESGKLIAQPDCPQGLHEEMGIIVIVIFSAKEAYVIIYMSFSL